MLIEIKTEREWIDELKEYFIAVSQRKKIKPKISLAFEDMDTMRRSLTENRLQLLSLIKNKKPQSIYALAKLAKRDFKNVYEDLKILKDFGLVECSASEKNRRKVKPNLLYTGLNLHFSF